MAVQTEITRPPTALSRHSPWLRKAQMALASLPLLLLCACGTAPSPTGNHQASIPVLRGWFEGEEVFYITTDVSHADVAEAKGANFAPRLADALPAGPPVPGRRSSVDKVYAVTNFKQPSIFASAPAPVGPGSRDPNYSPLWQMVKVTWQPGRPPRELRAEEAVLDATERGEVVLEPTPVVLNCPIVQRPGQGVLPGVSVPRAPR
jgi:hypothetical protein